MKQSKLKFIVQNELGKKISKFELKGKGMCNNVWFIETEDTSKYLIKQEREDKEIEEENDLLTEAKIITALNQKSPSLKNFVILKTFLALSVEVA